MEVGAPLGVDGLGFGPLEEGDGEEEFGREEADGHPVEFVAEAFTGGGGMGEDVDVEGGPNAEG